MKKNLDIYEPIFLPIQDKNEPLIIFLMINGLTEEEAKEKIKNGWKYPFSDEED